MSTLAAALTRAREQYFGVFLALFLTPHSVLVLLFGLIGISGNSATSALFFSCSTAAIWFLTFRPGPSLLLSDFLFIGLAAAIAWSSVANDWTTGPKEYALLLLSLSAYPACRFITHADLVRGRSAFAWTEAMLALSGATVTGWALIGQWDSEHAKPLVFGFEGAAIHFLSSVSFFLFALLMMGKTPTARVLLILLALLLPVAVFAASLVRFMFLALACTLIVAAFLSDGERRRNVVIAGLLLGAAVSLGLLARHEKVIYVAQFAIKELPAEQQSRPSLGPLGDAKKAGRSGEAGALAPSCSASVDLDNSLAIRKGLIKDGLWMLPHAGLFGTGLDSFMAKSCIPQTQIHNSVLQAFVEFGWVGGSFFALLIVSAFVPLCASARRDDASLFVFCGLMFMIMVALAHGRLSRDAVLFAMFGAAAGLRSSALNYLKHREAPAK